MNKKSYYFIGIGGIGMSSLAMYLKQKNNIVAGCDKNTNQKTIQILKNSKIHIDQETNCIDYLEKNHIDYLVLTNTVSPNHPAVIFANNNNIPIIYRGKLLGDSLLDKKIIGITGSHGKTSTTGMIAYVLNKIEIFPNVFIGGIIPEIKSNFIGTSSQYAVVEADDAYKSFLSIYCFISLVTSISLEHLETYNDLNDIFEAFLQFVEQTNCDGTIIINTDSETMKQFSSLIKRNYVSYGINKDIQNYAADNIQLFPFYSTYDFYKNNTFISHVKIGIPGLHQVKNSVGALTAIDCLGLPLTDSIQCLENYQGIERRLQRKGYFFNTPVFDDYGHHPVEIETTLKAFAKMSSGKKTVFFQPHKYSRTKSLWNDFIHVFSQAPIDKLYIVDVFAAEDPYDNYFNSKNMVDEINKISLNKAHYIDTIDFEHMKSMITKDISKEDIILCLGAGKLDSFADYLIS